MPLAQSKLTAQGQISVPLPVRRKLGLEPGSVLEWEDQDGQIVVRRAGTHSFEDIHKAAFGKQSPRPKTLAEFRKGITEDMRRRFKKPR